MTDGLSERLKGLMRYTVVLVAVLCYSCYSSRRKLLPAAVKWGDSVDVGVALSLLCKRCRDRRMIRQRVQASPLSQLIPASRIMQGLCKDCALLCTFSGFWGLDGVSLKSA